MGKILYKGPIGKIWRRGEERGDEFCKLGITEELLEYITGVWEDNEYIAGVWGGGDKAKKARKSKKSKKKQKKQEKAKKPN